MRSVRLPGWPTTGILVGTGAFPSTSALESETGMARRVLAWVILGAAWAAWAEEGTVRGRVRLSVVGIDGSAVPQSDASGVVVYIPDFTQPPKGDRREMRQQNKAFAPVLLPIQAGDTVEFKNDEKVFKHNVFSKSSPNDFDLGTAKAGETRSKVFTKPGRVDVFCDIHEQMVATIIVLPNHAFVHAAKDGTFVLPEGVPAGTHSLFAWRGHGTPARVTITVESGKDTTATVDLVELQAEAPPAHTDKRGQPYRSRDPYP